MDSVDVCIVGAGVIGLATAYTLARQQYINPERVLLLEALPDFGQGISSRSSEVIHGGIYYQPESLKAELCVEGKELLYGYLKAHRIGHQRCGKLIVAQSHQEDQLQRLYENGLANGVDDLKLLNQANLRQSEPALSACSAIFSPSTGIVDSHHYMHSLLDQTQRLGVTYAANTQVTDIEHSENGFTVYTRADGDNGEQTASYSFHTPVLVNCAGLKSTIISNKIKQLRECLVPKLWYCKGDYFSYSGKNPFSHLIYPLPEQHTAGLGIHSTMDLSGQLRFGPDVDYVNHEYYDVDPNKAVRFATAVARYFPGIQANKLQPAYSGIRPKLSGPGEPASDFDFQTEDQHGLRGLVQLHGIESPGLTASLAIGKHVAGLIGV